MFFIVLRQDKQSVHATIRLQRRIVCPKNSEFKAVFWRHFRKFFRRAPKFSNPAKLKIGAVFRLKNHCFRNTLSHNHLQTTIHSRLRNEAESGFPRGPYGSATGPLRLCNEAAVATQQARRCNAIRAPLLARTRFLTPKQLSKIRDFL